MRYDANMKSMLTWMMVLGFVLPGSAAAPQGLALFGEVLEVVVRGAGAEAGEATPAAVPAPQAPEAAAASAPEPAASSSGDAWREKGKRALGALGTLVDVAVEAAGPPASGGKDAGAPAAASASMGAALVGSFKPALDELIAEYKEQYKAEGRAYAREVGDIVVQRVVQDPEINATITSLRTLCWVVIAYLTLVTLIMLACLVYLKQANAQLLAEVRRLARRP